ncbi:MAG: tetratricopeptide repeat protein [Pseudomonadales bacterium]|nr:tetratricopeptide repeat protein [Pseudomonadales bacterium]
MNTRQTHAAKATRREVDARELCLRAARHQQNGRLQEALADYQRAAALTPNDPTIHYKIGTVRDMARHPEPALESFARAIELRPDFAWAHFNRGLVLSDLKRQDEALRAFDRAIALQPDFIHAYQNRATALEKLGRYEEALQGYEQAIALRPAYADAQRGRAYVLWKLGRYKESLQGYEQAAMLNPDDAQARYGKALQLLTLGNYPNGFECYEARWRCATPAAYQRNFPQAQWRGEPLKHQRILLHAEQGYGDCLQMLRYLPLVKQQAAQVILELPRELQPLLGPIAQGIKVVDFASTPPPFDLHCPLMSLPLAFGTQLASVPAPVPYLSAPPERLAKWRKRLPRSPHLRVGLVWSGRSSYLDDAQRSLALELLAPLFASEAIAFVSLQRDYRERDLATLARLPLERIDDGIDDFGDTAAAMEQCDLIISSDTAAAHLAGALGKPVWILLPFVADWRWLLARNDSPWYPSARLFRQRHMGDWDGLIAEVHEALRERVSAGLLPHA